MSNKPKLKIYRVPASHPCQAVIRGAQLKGIEYKLVDLLPLTQPVVASALFGSRTVPAMKIYGEAGGTQKVQTTVKCLRALESLVPEPALYPSDAAARERVMAAESWGVGEFQDLARRLTWVALQKRPETFFSFASDAKLPLPEKMLKPFGKPTIFGERLLNGARIDRAREDLEALPGHLDEIDKLISDGTIGGVTPNAADLTILSSVWLLRSLGDLREILDSRPAGRRTIELFGGAPGDIPEGAFPSEWLAPVEAARGSYVPA
ncbi:MAG: glutathione S-transferase [Solirubrobacterales bacterium]